MASPIEHASVETTEEWTENSKNDFFLAQYQALRAEILALQERGIRIQLAGLTGIPLLLGGSLEAELYLLLVSAPLIVLMAMLMVVSVQNSIMRAGTFIKIHVEKRYFPNAHPAGWEHFLQCKQLPGKKLIYRKVEDYTMLTVLSAFGLYYVGAVALAYIGVISFTKPQSQLKLFVLSLETGQSIALLLTIGYSILFIIFLVFLVKNYHRGTY